VRDILTNGEASKDKVLSWRALRKLTPMDHNLARRVASVVVRPSALI
jgi:hypothetical protein